MGQSRTKMYVVVLIRTDIGDNFTGKRLVGQSETANSECIKQGK